MNKYIVEKNKERFKKILIGFTIIDILLFILLGIYVNYYVRYNVVWVGEPIYYTKNNILNSVFNKEYFKQSLYNKNVNDTAKEVAKNTRGFSYFLNEDYISLIDSEYYTQLGFAYINKSTGDVVGNELSVINNLKGKVSSEEIISELENLFPNSYISIYDNVNKEGPYAEAAILSDNNDQYIEVYFKNKEHYNTILKQFRGEVFKLLFLCIIMLFIAIKSVIFLIRNGIKATISYNKEIFNSIVDNNFIDALYIGIQGGVIERNYLLLLIVATVINLFPVIFSRDYSYVIFNIFFMIIFEIIILIIYTDKIYYIKTLKELDNVNEENLHYTIDEKSPYYISSIIKEINLISKGYSKAVEERIKNDRLKTELISNVSHDLKTPLTSIINYIDILKREDISEEEKEDFLKIVSAKSRRLKLLIDDLFEAVKFEDKEIELDLHIIDIIELLNQVIEEYADNIENKRLKIKINFSDKEYKLYLDGNKMSRVFSNIISNICKYSKENTEVNITISKENERVKLSFENYSCYDMRFDDEEIFERFARGDKSRNSQIEGSGLGLSISKNIVQMHDGIMKIEKINNKFNVIIKL